MVRVKVAIEVKVRVWVKVMAKYSIGSRLKLKMGLMFEIVH